MKARTSTLLLITVWLAGCASGAPHQTSKAPVEADSEHADISEPYESGPADEIVALDNQLTNTLAEEVLDCPKAKELQERICTLADKICELEGERTQIETPRDTPDSLCEDARQRCDKAKEKLSERC